MTKDSLPTLGILGLGAMGGRMARNLIRSSYSVRGYDLIPERREALTRAGGLVAETEALIRDSDIVLTSLPSSEAFVRLAEETLLPNARPGQIFIELGTTVPLEIRRLAPRFAEVRATLLDVPVSGWITGAENGTLSMWAGGDLDAFERCLPILRVLGDPERIVYCGESGMGQAVKGVNQLKSALLNAAMLEAVAFGIRAGVGIETLERVFRGGGGSLSGIMSRIREGRGDEIGVKFRELPYYLREAEAQGFRLPLTETLFGVCDAGERVVEDDNRPAPSFWHELMKE